MSLIDYTYFVGEINLPNTNKADMQERLNLFIAKYEKKFLTDLLGYQLYSDFTTGLTQQTPLAIWTAIRDGKVYTYNQRNFQWRGLVQPDTKTSPIANYVYCKWLQNEASQTSVVGEVETKTDNAERISPKYKIQRAWNEMVSDVWHLASFLDVNSTDYPSWSWYGDTNGSYWMNYNNSRLKDMFYPVNSLNL